MSGEENDVLRELGAARRRYESTGWPRPDLLLVSGSGLAVDLGAPSHGPLPLAELLPFPVHRVAGHPHQVELLEPLPGRRVLYCRGRLHTYQGYDPHQAVLPVRLAAQLGARTLLQTNAAGSLRPHLPPGRLVAVRDHLNLMGMNPLRGELPEDWGPRFPIMSGAYDADLRELAAGRAAALGVQLGEGVYAGIAGPTYETPAEAEMLRTLGA
ncbi:MAG: purine-nucleoside phosphorylase, partial [Acidobacteriota bacterium]